MTELDIGTLPPLETDPPEDPDFDSDSDAPWGYKADGTPRKKPGRPKGSSGGSGTSKSSRSDSAFAERISEELVELAAPVGIFSPLAMWHIAERAERTSKALVVISKKHPAVRAAIETYFASVAYKDLALFILGIPVAIAMDMQMLKPTAMVGKVWRFEEGWQEIYGENGEYPSQNGHYAQARGLAGEI